jgi:hypothetical protein
MGLRSLLSNPNGGQLFSAYVLLVFAVILATVIAGNLAIKVVHGDPIEINRDGIGLIGMLIVGIPAILKFVRSRHAR